MRTIAATRVPGKPPRRMPMWADFGLSPQEPAWQQRAACRHRDGGTFFPESGTGDGDGVAIAAAKRVCTAYPVRPQCLRHALAHEEAHGIWGGLTEQERHRLTHPGERRTVVRASRARDNEIARLTRARCSAPEIADTLAINPRTVTQVRARLRDREEVA